MSERDETLPIFQKLHKHTPKLAQKLSLVTSTSAITANSLLMGAPLYAAGLAKILGKSKRADQTIINIANRRINTNNYMIDHILPAKDWRIKLPDNLKPNGKYLLICNHQSWVDTSIIQYISQDRLPITRFFTKHELIYIPVVGQTFYFLDFPMMKRHSKKQIQKNPKLAGRDIDEAKRACSLLKDKPFVLLNYLEGTRFTEQKHKQQQSPYKNLLKPKAGGFALAVSSLGNDIDGILDMTLVYPDGTPTYSDLWQGNIKRLSVDICQIDMPAQLFEDLKQGKYDHDDATRQALYQWLDETWQAKDQKINRLLSDFSNENSNAIS